ncbi:SubName: Full=Related to glycoside hydrolase family 23 protein-Laccaria bicolor {ECO:0000313/EMBL:CCA67359.1} [Serendipita indica DSM 11827]|nr:SubName: Full=Related to glycoside hydrolase family 23 protein-Laccaria bicolor {ECO:0000313/EMBL:CCA67359.1} [Serendipita indica DSM 11827]
MTNTHKSLLFLPLFLLAHVLAVTGADAEAPNALTTNTTCTYDHLARTHTSPDRRQRWWSKLSEFLLLHLPGDAYSDEQGFFNDLQLALNTVPPSRADDLDPDELCSPRHQLFPRDQQVLKTKCRVKPVHYHPGWNGDIPNYTPTDSNGNPLPTQTIGDGHGGFGQEIIGVNTRCPYNNVGPGATVATNTSTGPNGQFTWLTCGLDPKNNSIGWTPPYATADQVITFQGGLRAAIKAEGSPYKSCAKFVELFETAGAEFQVPPLFIAAFALQESGCNPDIDGAGGEQGMMQISPEKCDKAPGGNCKDVIYNVRTAVKYFSDVLKSVNGNVFEAVGLYNGWIRGMSYKESTTWGINGDCCRCQRNLSYLSQFFNGWLQNMDAWALMLGSIHNTADCPA